MSRENFLQRVYFSFDPVYAYYVLHEFIRYVKVFGKLPDHCASAFKCFFQLVYGNKLCRRPAVCALLRPCFCDIGIGKPIKSIAHLMPQLMRQYLAFLLLSIYKLWIKSYSTGNGKTF